MRISTTSAEIRSQLKALRGHKSIAFVPTMGCLHAGHISLIEKARTLADIVVVSVYVNPLQFGANEDLDTYPRSFDADARACADADVDFLFHPATLYPEHGPNISLKTTKLSDCLCGAARPGHFDGVVTVVNILFNIVQPDIAVFGEKDWQQLAIIRCMVSDLHMPIEIVGGRIVREADGLAMSSRNRYLSDSERTRALAISRAMTGMQLAARDGETDAEALKTRARNILENAAVQPEYIDIRHAISLKEESQLKHQPTRAFIAARVGNTRLIDNVAINTPLSCDGQ